MRTNLCILIEISVKKRMAKKLKGSSREFHFSQSTTYYILFFSIDVATLHCFVGLGNTSKKREMKVYECPEGKFYVCAKMYGKGMGDQIKRYCEAIPREVINWLAVYLIISFFSFFLFPF